MQRQQKGLNKIAKGITLLMLFGMVTILVAVGAFVLCQIIGLSTAEQKEKDEKTLDNSMHVLVGMQNERWVELTKEERLNLLQTVIEVEKTRLGLSQDLSIKLYKAESGQRSSYYDDDKGEIGVAEKRIEEDDCWFALSEVLHQCYHSYQCRIIELYEKLPSDQQKLMIFRKIKEYGNDLRQLVKSKERSFSLTFKPYEKDAREYESEAVKIYHDKLMDYLYGEIRNSN